MRQLGPDHEHLADQLAGTIFYAETLPETMSRTLEADLDLSPWERLRLATTAAFSVLDSDAPVPQDDANGDDDDPVGPPTQADVLGLETAVLAGVPQMVGTRWRGFSG